MRPKEALSRVELLKDVPDDALDELVQRATTMKMQPGRVIVEQGNTDSGLALILEGTAEVSVNGVTRASLGEGDYFGEMSLLDGAPRSATVTAGPEGAKTLAISPLTFTEVLDAYPGVARSLLVHLVGRIRSLESTLGS
ncbi:MAG TPA: cyclic nucleotide-binding domain-containing protein [Actinomycetes bacterium]|nr:cyclic nucleotide-binding domain-containing protein [Actinomycetes bacterium]